METVDHKWGGTEKEHRDKIDEVKAELAGIKERLEKAPDNGELNARLKKAENELGKLENVFRVQQDKYEKYRSECREKWQEELKDIG